MEERRNNARKTKRKAMKQESENNMQAVKINRLRKEMHTYKLIRMKGRQRGEGS